MSPVKFFAIAFIVFSLIGLVLFFKTIPPSAIFHRSLTTAQPTPTLAAALPDYSPHEYPLPPPSPGPSDWSTQTIPEKQLQFSYPDVWGTPSASLTLMKPPDSGTLMGVYFVDNYLEDTPVFLEITSPDYNLPSTPSALFSQTQGNLTNTILTDGDSLAYYTFATLPHLKIYVYLPAIQKGLDTANLEEYFRTTSARIFSGTGLSATDSANLRDFQKLVKSITSNE